LVKAIKLSVNSRLGLEARRMIKHHTTTVLLFSHEEPTRVLLGLHKKLQVWLPPGGHCKETENPLETAIRETLEECGINISPYLPKVQRIDEYADRIPNQQYFFEELIPEYEGKPAHKHLDYVYVVYIPYQQFQYPKGEYEDMRWLTKEEIKHLPHYKNLDYELDQNW